MSKVKKAKALTKNQLASELSEKTGLNRGQVVSVLDALEEVVAKELKSKGVVSPLPGLIKVSIKHKKATSARPGRNPSTGESITISAKPARKTVGVRALKRLKAMA